jgi:SsrA-binding protein
VKSIRAGLAQISESFVRLDGGVPILYHAHISEYSHGSNDNHNPYKPARLSLHKKEIRKIMQAGRAAGTRWCRCAST